MITALAGFQQLIPQQTLAGPQQPFQGLPARVGGRVAAGVASAMIERAVFDNGLRLLTNKIVGKAFSDHADAYAGQCKM